MILPACFPRSSVTALEFAGLLLVAAVFVSGCNAPIKVNSTTHTPLAQQTREVAEAELLDVGVLSFDPGLDEESDDDTVLPQVRMAEAHYLANQLTETIQETAAWGAVRMLPSETVVTDIYVRGQIVHSDGERLELDIAVSDSSGKTLFKKGYEEEVGKYAYERRKQLDRDPFQGLFNRIANDLLIWRQSLSASEAIAVRTISQLRFAREFAPEAYTEHLQTDKKGHLKAVRLPAINDPILQRIQRLRERDYLYIDTVQEYYDGFSRNMQGPYQSWRSQSYDEVLAARELKRQSLQRTVGGVAAVVAGIAAAGSNSGAARAGGAVAIGSGALLVKSGLAKKAEAQIHVEALAELGESLEAELEPRVIELEDQTITLTGNVQAQYQQWQEILQKIYRAERGQ